MEILITRAEAKAQGLTHYFTGEPCKYGHLSLKRVDNYGCTECNVSAQQSRRKRNPEKCHKLQLELERREAKEQPEKYQRRKRNSKLRYSFGIDLIEYETKETDQDGKCASCGETCKSGRRLAVDHHHTTGQVRDLLCGKCNMALGLLDEDPEKILNLLAYIKRWSATD